MKYKLLVMLVLFGLVFANTKANAQAPILPANQGSLPRPTHSYWSQPGTATPPNGNETLSASVGNAALATSAGILNPSFELGQFSSWTESSSNNFDIVVPSSALNDPAVTAHTGSWIAWLGDYDNEVSIISQPNILITSPATLSLWYWIGSGDSCGGDFGYLKINTNTIYTWTLCDANNTFGWANLQANLDAYNGQTVTLSIEVHTNATNPSGMLIDDVYLNGRFGDVPYGYWAFDYIDRLYNAGITGGCTTSPLNYCPGNTVTRAQMAIFLLRAEHGSAYTPPAATGTMFADVPASNPTAAWIEQLAKEGITGGCGGGNYCPNNSVTRAQMAIFLLRGEHGSTYTPPAATGTMFLDVPASSSTAPWIEQLANENITGGCGGGNYCPGKAVTRDQMAVFLVRTFKLP